MLIETQNTYTTGAVDGALNFADYIIEQFQQEDARLSKSRYKSASEKIRSYATQFQLEAEQQGFPTDEHMKQLDKIAYAFCGLMAGLMIAGIMVAI